MSTINDGGPAFPHVVKPRPDIGPNFAERFTDGGMSLRDWFAGQALVGMLSRKTYVRTTRVHSPSAVRQAWELADAMLAERAKEKQS